MAWRPSHYLIHGILDNVHLGRVTGTLKFEGMDDPVLLDLAGDFHRDIRGAKLELLGDPNAALSNDNARRYFVGFSNIQTGKVGDITAGLPPHDYVPYPYIEWYSDQNGRVVLEYEASQVRVVGTPIPHRESFPISRDEQARNMSEFLRRMTDELRGEKEDDADGDRGNGRGSSSNN